MKLKLSKKSLMAILVATQCSLANASNIERLPDDAIISIFNFVPHRDLNNIILISKNFTRICNIMGEHMCKNVKWDPHNDDSYSIAHRVIAMPTTSNKVHRAKLNAAIYLRNRGEGDQIFRDVYDHAPEELKQEYEFMLQHIN